VTALAVVGAIAPGAAVVAPSLLAAQTASGRNATLWVTLGDSDQLVEVDPYAFNEVRRITTDPRPHGLAASRDGSKIYVGSDRTGNLQVIDARSGRIEAQIPLGKDPNQLTLTADGRYYRAGDRLMAARIDTASGVRVLSRRVAVDGFLPPSYDDFDIHPDRRTLALIQPMGDAIGREVTMVLGWFADLRRLIPSP
jgi:YVTN family beta-propeller protein